MLVVKRILCNQRLMAQLDLSENLSKSNAARVRKARFHVSPMLAACGPCGDLPPFFLPVGIEDFQWPGNRTNKAHSASPPPCSTGHRSCNRR
jgi:hypothetical protein